jgi:hypothetical protein
LRLEIGMFRIASLFALACLTLAAASLLATPKVTAEEPQPEKDRPEESGNRCKALLQGNTVPFHARFSVN